MREAKCERRNTRGEIREAKYERRNTRGEIREAKCERRKRKDERKNRLYRREREDVNEKGGNTKRADCPSAGPTGRGKNKANVWRDTLCG
ncbi:hypothetical protein POVWA2_050910 [Plasmodium ovale wallikeri]|uniref:Uncharacterized protein n=1 Tax=Plasmodium ovale wallikeri TaxID=864142 RepID=A0A1A8ZN46_PLAOA|nr:hypothetical protein POVWA1_051650 [Plasmodium ovale wallikeri]SBT45923.1 hypothetical protein POVWA2_050910 [Plasmodium ovale wallikeri]